MKENEMIFGIRAIIEAIKSDKQIDKIILKNDMQSELAKELFNAINFKPLSYYNMKNIKYNIQQMNFTKELINKAYSYLERNKNKNFMDSLSDIL
jgi:tRNA G18 (ribose-2'-O)-methylase SpoU